MVRGLFFVEQVLEWGLGVYLVAYEEITESEWSWKKKAASVLFLLVFCAFTARNLSLYFCSTIDMVFLSLILSAYIRIMWKVPWITAFICESFYNITWV